MYDKFVLGSKGIFTASKMKGSNYVENTFDNLLVYYYTRLRNVNETMFLTDFQKSKGPIQQL